MALPSVTAPLPDDAVGSLDDPSMPATTDSPGAVVLDPPVFITDPPGDAGAWGDLVVLVEAFWADSFAEFAGGGSYDPLDRDRIVAVDDNETGLPACDRDRISAIDVEDNAFAAVCPEGQLILWDDDDLFAELFADYGATGPAIVIAHEFGHAVQFQAGTLNQPTLVIEQQADCLAGAFARWTNDRGVFPFNTQGALDAAIGSTISFRDQPGASAADAVAQGSGVDRVRAFQDGFESGVDYCAQYSVEFLSPQITQIPFSQEEFLTGGNLGFEALIDIVTPYFNRVYGTLSPDWTELTLTPDDLADWVQLHRQIGDNATGTAMALEFGAQVQRQLGRSDTGVDAFLQQTCLAGAAFRPLISDVPGLSPPPEEPLSLSAGDMDEAVLTLSRIVEVNQDSLDDGFLFEAVSALRLGFTEGFDACNLR